MSAALGSGFLCTRRGWKRQPLPEQKAPASRGLPNELKHRGEEAPSPPPAATDAAAAVTAALGSGFLRPRHDWGRRPPYLSPSCDGDGDPAAIAVGDCMKLGTDSRWPVAMDTG